MTLTFDAHDISSLPAEKKLIPELINILNPITTSPEFELCKEQEMDTSTALFNQLKLFNCRVGLPLIFKSSFDKANRTSSKSFRGPGMAEGLKILEKVKVMYDIPVVTDVHEGNQCEAVGRVADIIQIPAFLCRQTDLLVAAAKTGRIINIKKGQFCAPSVKSRVTLGSIMCGQSSSTDDLWAHLMNSFIVMVNSAEKVRLAGNQNVMVCERGTMFGYNDLIVDPRNFEWMREANCPVVADVTHSLQQPAGLKIDGGGVASGGLRELIPCIARTAVAVGVDGIFMEPLRHLEELLEEIIAIAFIPTGFLRKVHPMYHFRKEDSVVDDATECIVEYDLNKDTLKKRGPTWCMELLHDLNEEPNQ
ncbi:2-dehydro-3-deoxyphosphooctonate aldolase 1 [Asimina triloba]